MIFISVGTQEFPFSRLLDKIITLKNESKIEDSIIIQSGSNKYLKDQITHDDIVIVDFLTENDFLETLEKSRIFITHGGTGSIIAASKLSIKTIVVPRLMKFNEHVDDHQLEISTAFYEKGIIEICFDIDFLEDIIKNTENKFYKTYENNNFELINDLKKFIQE